ncbi:MAG TPA: type 1 glutamine amidotransferase domain-containing protein [Novosphingobium sp.]|nr:type 1 glutamine amidotransferase domain-containing protein [Novosphingobium sp.]
MRKVLLLLCLMLFGLTGTAVRAANAPAPARDESPRVLLVVSSHGRGEGKIQPGFEMDELTQAWLVLRANGFAVDIASPEGGRVQADEFDPAKPYNAAFLADPEAKARLDATQRLDPAMAGRYAAIMVIGGKGAMFDLPFSQILQDLLLEADRRGAVIAAVCHGPAVLARLRQPDGSNWVSGRLLTGFSDEEEAMFGKRWVPHFPFLLETELRRLDARFDEAPIMLPRVAVDGRLVTGQNPYSVAGAADAVVRLLGQTPVARTPWPDEWGLTLVARALDGDEAPLIAGLARGDGSVDAPLVAVWGYYRALQAGENRAQLAQALRIMEIAYPHFPQPELRDAISETRKRLAP